MLSLFLGFYNAMSMGLEFVGHFFRTKHCLWEKIRNIKNLLFVSSNIVHYGYLFLKKVWCPCIYAVSLILDNAVIRTEKLFPYVKQIFS